MAEVMAQRATAWRYLVSPPLTGAENMAWDEALMARARRTGEAVLRVYAWSAPTLSLGRNQTARGAYDLARAAERGIDFVRRPTGGRALLHHREVTYSVTAPETFDPSPRGAYERINVVLLDALRALGVPASLAATPSRTPAPGLSPCFAQPSAGEIVLGAGKLVGSAQWRHAGAMLQHGSILIHDDQALIGELMLEPDSVSLPAAATLHQALGVDAPFRGVSDALIAALEHREAPGAEPLVVDGILARDIDAAAERYRDPAWTWRR
jgi:lipoyl(octanoyl) transferase